MNTVETKPERMLLSDFVRNYGPGDFAEVTQAPSDMEIGNVVMITNEDGNVVCLNNGVVWSNSGFYTDSTVQPLVHCTLKKKQ